jgi:hypothetical protein
MVDEFDVVMAYRLLLDENPKTMIVKGHAANYKTLADLRAGFMSSQEFVASTIGGPVAAPKSRLHHHTVPGIFQRKAVGPLDLRPCRCFEN